MIGTSYRAICGVAVCYRAICKVGACYRAICIIRISYYAICKVGACYRAICKIGFWNVNNARLIFRKSYLWWFTNLACGDLVGTNGIEKDLVHGPPGLVWGKGLVWLSVSEVLIWSGRETEGLVLVFMSFCSTLILSGGWWHGISSFFLILLEGRGGGEVSSRLGWLFCFVLFWFISSFRFCVCSVYLVDELVPVFLVLLKEVRMLR